jgi:hypothetical protein
MYPSALQVDKFVQSGGVMLLSRNANTTLTALNNFTLTGGTFNMSDNGFVGTLNIGKDFTYSAGASITETSSKYGQINLNGTTLQTVSINDTLRNDIRLLVKNNAIVDFGVSIVVGAQADFTVASGSTVYTQNAGGYAYTGASGLARVESRSFQSGANYGFNGTAAQVTGNALSLITPGKMYINNAAGVTMNTPISFGDSVILGNATAYSVLSDGGNQITSTSAIQILNHSRLVLGSATSATTFPTFNPVLFDATATIEYAAGIPQTINTGITYPNLVLSGAGQKNVDGNLIVNGDLSPSGGTLSLGSSIVTLNGSLTGSGDVSLGTGSIDIKGDWINTGIFTPGTSTVTFSGNDNQIIGVPGSTTTFYNVVLDSTGTKTFAGPVSTTGDLILNQGTTLNTAGEDLTLAGTNSNNLGTFNAGTGAVNYIGSGNQTIENVVYYNLGVSGGGDKTLDGNTIVNGSLSIANGGILDLGEYTLGGNLEPIHNSGIIKVSSTLPNAIPGGKTWNGEVQYILDEGGQTVSSGSFEKLTISNASGVNNVAGSLNITGTLTTTAGGILNMGDTAILSGNANIINNGTISTSVPSSLSTTPIPAGKTWTGNVSYDNANGAQTVVSGVYTNLTMNNAHADNTLGGNITVDGALNLKSEGEDLALGSNTLTINGVINNMTATTALQSNGSSSIVIGGSGALGSNLYLDQSAPNTSNRLENLVFNRAGETITMGDTIQVAGVITPTAGALATGDKLVLVSNANGTASVAAGVGNYITGKVTAQNYCSNAPNNNRRWKFVGSPVSGVTLRDLQDNIFVTGANGASNGFDPTLSNQVSAYTYTEIV